MAQSPRLPTSPPRQVGPSNDTPRYNWSDEAIRAVKTISKTQMKNIERFKQALVEIAQR